MSIWSTKSFNSNRNYIVIQHNLRGVNYYVGSIKFRSGYAVVEKDSKTYRQLRQTPVLKNVKEFPLTYLRKLPFITRALDIKLVYGQDVYARFLEEEKLEKQLEEERIKSETAEKRKQRFEDRVEQLELNKEIEAKIEEALEEGKAEVVEQLKEQIVEDHKCKFVYKDDKICMNDALDHSPSQYCHYHIFEDPRLEEFGIEVPKYISKSEKVKLKEKIKTVCEKAKSQGKF